MAIPPLPTQRKIAAILSAYDDLIENNTRRIKILEEMAQAIYREWFVHFRFPGHEGVRMVESELGLIPEGWEVSTLFSLFPHDKGVVMTGPFGSNLHAADYSEDGSPLILVKHVKNGRIIEKDLPLVGEPKLSELRRYQLKYGDIVITRVGFVGESAFIYSNYEGWLFSGQMLRVRIPDNLIIQPRYLAQFYQSESFKKLIENFAVGTTRLSLNTEILTKMLILLPPITIQTTFTQFVECIDNLILILTQKNTNLRRTRDLLLPKLISGELDVSELDITIPEENT